MILTGEEARDVVYDDHDDWEKVYKKIDGHSRWAVQYEGVYLHKPTKEHYCFCWQKGATESQDEQPFEYETQYSPTKVREIEVIGTGWVPV